MISERISSAANTANPGSLSNRLRQKRFERIRSMADRIVAENARRATILDLGGTALYWEMMGISDNHDYEITTLNILEPKEEHPIIKQLVGDATDTGMEDNSYDLVVSNSVIEHVGGLFDQLQMGTEVERLAPNYYIQTPCISFPMEPHYYTLLAHPFFPPQVRVSAVQRAKKIPRVEADDAINRTRLMSRSELATALPHASISLERFMLLPKSWILTREQ